MSIHLHPDELIFHKVGDDIISAGFGINSILLRRGLPEMLTFSTNANDAGINDTNDETSDNPSLFRSFKNLAVPFGLFTSNNYNKHPPNEDAEYMGSIPDSLHETLLNHATYKPVNLTKKKKPKPTKHNNKSAKKRNKK